MNTPSAKQPTVRATTAIYLLLCVLTLVTWALGSAGVGGLWVALLVLALALIKGQLVGDWFMGLRRVRGFWRWVVSAWLLLIGLTVPIAFILAN